MNIGDWNIKRKLKAEVKSYGGSLPNIPDKCWEDIVRNLKNITELRLKNSNNPYDYIMGVAIKDMAKIFAVMLGFYKPENIRSYQGSVDILSGILDKYSVSYRKIDFTKD